MNMITMLIVFLMGFGVIASMLFLTMSRTGKNILTSIAFRKKYVVCHMKNENTGFTEIWKVVPPTDKLTSVGKHHYNLKPEYSIIEWKGRLHFQLSEGDVIPRYLSRTNTKEEILIQVDETDTAINTRAYKIIYGKQKDIALIIGGIALLIALLTAIYAIYSIDKFGSAIQTMQMIYSNVSVIRN